MHWTIEKTLDLIELYKERTLLWDPKHLRYREKKERRKAYDEISTVLQVHEDECERKIHSLRTQFQREFKRKGKKSAWFAYEQLRFLLNGPRSGNMVEATDDGQDSIKDEKPNSAESRKVSLKIERYNPASQNETINEPLSTDSISNGLIVLTDDFRPQVSTYRNNKHRDPLDTLRTITPPQPKIQRVEYVTNNENTVTMEVRHNSTELTPLRESTGIVSTLDSFDLFGKYIAEELRSVRDDVYATQVAKHRINQILFEATTGAFRRPLLEDH